MKTRAESCTVPPEASHTTLKDTVHNSFIILTEMVNLGVHVHMQTSTLCAVFLLPKTDAF